MTRPDERKSESWIAWITLLLAALAWLCVIIVSATKGVEETLRIHRGWAVGEARLQVPMLLASPIYAALAVLSYFVLRRLGYHSRKNTIGLLLSAIWLSFGLLVSSGVSSTGEHVPRARCLGNLKHLGLACYLYAGDRAGEFPGTVRDLYDMYVFAPDVFVCPVVERRFEPRKTSLVDLAQVTYILASGRAIPARRLHAPIVLGQITYCYVSGSSPGGSADHILAFDEEWNHNGEGVNVLYVDGHVGWTPDIGELHARLRRQTDELKAKGREVRIIRPSWSRYPDRPVYTWPPWYIGWAGAFACVAVGFLIPVGGLLLWERWRKRRRTGIP